MQHEDRGRKATQAVTNCDAWGKEGTDADSSYNTHDRTWTTAPWVGATGAGVDGWPGRQGLETPAVPAREEGRHHPASCVGRPAPCPSLCHARRKRRQWRPVWWDPVNAQSQERPAGLLMDRQLNRQVTPLLPPLASGPPPLAAAACSQRWRHPQHAAAALSHMTEPRKVKAHKSLIFKV
jgi:hypothetical protein